MALTIHDAHNGARHLACDSCGWTTDALSCSRLPSQVWHAFELDHDDAATGCPAIVPDPLLRLRYEQAFAAWTERTLRTESIVLPLTSNLGLAS